ncbi:hypothetical protein OE88DRAFT_1658855 [Heliocybe sulcata]|uniref:Uncharacterized protein n=1 Tax=Heliocybe sulcata TaxID=5364 RepID=A0A5C3NEU7_9AGAM|nr:hypothetical protein OE88DRAFT_1658855 [Heliocybe sulcata]
MRAALWFTRRSTGSFSSSLSILRRRESLRAAKLAYTPTYPSLNMPFSIPLSFLLLTPKRVPIPAPDQSYLIVEPEEEEEMDALGREWEMDGGARDGTGRRKAKMRLTWGGLKLKKQATRPQSATFRSDGKWRRRLSGISLHLPRRKSRPTGEEIRRSFFDHTD